MGGRDQGHRPSTTSTPSGQLPTGTPQGYGLPDHSFTLQTIMELQKSMGTLTGQVQHLSTLIERLESASKDSTNKHETKLEALSDAVQEVKTKISLTSKIAAIVVAGILFLIGGAWSLAQSTIADIAKSAITQAFNSGQQSVASQPPAILQPAQPKP
ncbi:MAG: hypothetical protein CTR55_00515 [Pseudomonas sp.]|nr:MAG: hypothetical protein CTR55_00515 [Pseudomonas sp.]